MSKVQRRVRKLTTTLMQGVYCMLRLSYPLVVAVSSGCDFAMLKKKRMSLSVDSRFFSKDDPRPACKTWTLGMEAT